MDRHAAVVLAAVVLCFGGVAQAADFRVETQVFDDGASDEPRLLAENLTLLSGQYIYDYLLGDALETCVLDTRSGRFVLLDSQREVRTAVDRNNLLKFVAAMNISAKKAGPIYRFAADPSFRETYDEATARLTLANRLMTYEVRGMEMPDAHTAGQYTEFLDWYTRISATHAGALPPQARLELNRCLFQHGIAPREVRLRINRPDPQPPLALRSVHKFAWRLTPDDRRRIERTKTAMIDFTEVAFSEFRQLDLVAEVLAEPPR